jgi:alcohol dehydrogenase
MIVALGGENVLSLGRLAAAVSRSSLHAGDLMERSKPGESALPVLEIPSSGRYFLMFRKEAFLVDKVSSRAVLVSLPESLSGLVLVDSSIAGRMPVRVSSLSMASVFFAAVEAFLSPRSDFFSDVQSRSAVRKAAGLLRVVKEQSADPDYRIQEAEAAVLTAFATGLTGPGPGVILSRAVSAAVGVPKAATEAVLLPWVLESPLYSGSPKLKELSALIAEFDEDISKNPAEDIRALFGRLDFPGRLREMGAELADILPAAGWSVDMMETGRSDFDERTFRDILEFAS